MKIETYNKTESFLLEYASGKYGKCKDVIDVTEDTVKIFMEKVDQEGMEEVLNYLQFTDEMKSNMYGSEDLEDWIDHIVNYSDN